MNNILLIISSVTLNAFAQLFIRQGMLKLGKISMGFVNIWHMILDSITNVYIWAGMFSYGISILLWMVVLSRVNVSLAYPFLSIGYIITTVISHFAFNEPITVPKILGISIICIGVVVLTYSKDFVR